MSAVSWPGAVPFDPDSGAASRVWQALLDPSGRVPASLLLISGEAARYSGWSGRATVELADALAAREKKVLLVDLHFDAPDLGELASTAAEGLSDALLFGASLEHVAASPSGRSFSFVSTGPAVPEAEELFRHPAWDRLLDEAARSDRVVLGYAPWRARGLEALLARFETSLFLGGTADARIASGYLPPDIRVLGVVTPFAPVKVAPTVAQPDAPPAAEPVEEPAAQPLAGRPPSSTPTVPVGPPRRAEPWLAMLAVLIVVGGATMWVGLSRAGEGTQSSPTSPQSVVPDEPVAAAAPYSVAVESHQDLGAAAERLSALTAAEPTMGFYLTPILVDSVLYYRLMAGPVRDSAEAGLLLAELVARGHKTASSDWDIRSTPYAFLLGSHDSFESAAERAANLAAVGIPAYVLEVAYASGATRYHLYCGAYAGAAEADVMRQLLDGAGLEASLVQRVGRSPS